MPTRNIGIVLVRLFCIYLAITAIQSLSYVIPGLFEFGFRSSFLELLGTVSIWLTITTILLPGICAYWLWRNTDFVLPKQMADDLPSANAAEIMLIGVSLLGLYLLIWGLINLVRVETSLAGLENVDAYAKMSQRVPYLAQIVISAPLLLGRRRLSELLLKAKYAGTGAM
ncbi:MAG: hypothetical protein KJO01_13285 [Gammaproteobacteria bacterium]|nr:hypothetical protein [Gammaproteobacteria bacterium]NND47235.1 hypothetical protein [Woeseiaceae bacterium]NNL52154.1 hypothetical protein [Woeseiaceae bacterium]